MNAPADREDFSGHDLLVSSASIFAPQLTTDGAMVFTGLVRPSRGGGLLVLAYLGGDDETQGGWLVETFDDPPARRMAACLQVIADGGGEA